MNIKRIFAAALVMALVFSAAPARASEPRVVLEQIGDALDSADSEKFAELVDINALVEDALNRGIDFLHSPEIANRASPFLTLTLGQLRGTGGKYLRPMLVGEARAFVLNGVSSGAFAGKKTGAPAQSGVLAPLFANASMGKKEIRGVGDGRPDGDDYLLPFSIHDYGNDNDYAIVGRFVPTADGYRLARVENLEELFRQILAESER